MGVMGKNEIRPALCGKSASALLLLASLGAHGQTAAATSGSGNSASGASSSSNLGAVTQVQQQLSQPGPAISPGNATDQSFRGSVVHGKAAAGTLALTLDDAIQRGLRYNLGVVLQSSDVKSANGQRLQELQSLLPTLTAGANITVEQVNLAAYGLRFPGISPIIGPFQVIDFRAYLTQNLVNLQSIQNYISAKHNFAASKLTADDARDMVVLTVGNAYLLCTADAARITAVEAQIAESKLSLDQATAAHEAGTSPRLDVLRAQVDYQSQQQNLISANNQLAKDKIALARVIGLPLDQVFTIADQAPYASLDTPEAEAAFQQALKQRKDLAADAEKVEAAKAGQKAAFDEQLPRPQRHRRLRRPRHHGRPLPQHLHRHRPALRPALSVRQDPRR